LGKGKKRWRLRSAEEAEDYIASITSEFPQIPELEALLHLCGSDVCPIPVITPLSAELARMYNFCRDKFPYPGGFHDQLAIYVQAAGVISSVEAEIMRPEIDV
jgi:hypothetical protein